MELASHDQEYELDVIDARDPLLVFTEDGRRVPATSSLAPEPVWLLYRRGPTDGGNPVDLHVDGDLLDAYDVPAPYGWLGWTLRRADLRQVSELRLGDGMRRRVKGARRAQLQLAQPLSGVTSLAGAPVVATTPLLTLPTESGVTTEWSIRIRRPGAGQRYPPKPRSSPTTRSSTHGGICPDHSSANTKSPSAAPSAADCPAPSSWPRASRPPQTPPGERLEPTDWNRPTVRASTRLHGLTVTPAMALLGSKETSADLQVEGRSGTTRVRMTPAHMAVQRLGGDTRTDWSLQPIRLDTETIGDGELLVRLPRAVDAQLIVRAAGSEIQTVTSGATYGQPLARFRLAAIADTVGTLGVAQLDVRLDGQDFPVARCTPRRLASAVRVEHDRLVLDDGVRAEGLVAGLYRVFAPWQPPHVVDINLDLVSDPLPSEVTATGPLVALLRIEDPWLPADWPDWPGRTTPSTSPASSWKPTGEDSAAEALSGYLAGSGDLPDRPDVAPLLFELYPRADGVRGRGVAVNVRGTAAILRKASRRRLRGPYQDPVLRRPAGCPTGALRSDRRTARKLRQRG